MGVVTAVDESRASGGVRCSRDYAHPGHETDTGRCAGIKRVVVDVSDLAAEVRAALRGAR